MKTDSYLQAQYRRLVPRLGRKKAIVSLARRILEVVYTCSETPRASSKNTALITCRRSASNELLLTISAN